MANYKYQALTPRGETTAGSVYASTEAGAIISLRNQGLYPTQIHKITDKDELIADAEGPRKKKQGKKMSFGKWTIFFFACFIGSALTYITILTLY